MNRSADWLHQAQADLELAGVSAAAGCRATTPSAMPVRSLTPSLLRWPEPGPVLNQVRLWAVQLAAEHPGLERVGLFGSYGRGDAGVGAAPPWPPPYSGTAAGDGSAELRISLSRSGSADSEARAALPSGTAMLSSSTV
jgi:hypothetical protein